MDDNNSDQNFPVNPTQNGKGPLSGITPLFFIFIALSVVFFLYQIVGGMLTFMLLGEDLQSMDENLNLTRIIMSFAQFMFILFPSVILVMLRGDNIKETFRLNKPKMSVLFFAVIGILAVQPFLQVFLYYQNEFIFSLPFGQEVIKQMKDLFEMLESTTEKLVIAKSLPEFILITFVIAVTPAFSEEFLFRGLVLKYFEKIIPPAKAIFFSGLLFSLFHFHPFNIIPLTILGIFLSFMVYHSGSIYTAVICHFINNFISASAVYLYGTESLGSDKMSSEEQIQFLMLGAASVVVFLFVIFMIKKYSVMKNSGDFNDKFNQYNSDNITASDE